MTLTRKLRGDALDCFSNTALSRLDNPSESLILVAMQRLHVDDLSGVLIERGWPNLVVPAIAIEPADYLLSDDEVYHRPSGELLQPGRDNPEAIEELKRESVVGSSPRITSRTLRPPPDGNMIKADWLGRYEPAPDRKKFVRVVLTCDPAGKAGTNNDYTAITIIGVQEKALHLLQVRRGHWTVLQMREQIIELAEQWNVDLIIVEDTSNGMGLIQLLHEQIHLDVIGRRPDADKETRLCRHQGRFEAGRILLPTEADWLADFEAELLAFPHGRYDDQVDALLLLLDWYAQHEQYIHPVILPELVRPDPWPDWSPRY